MKRPVLGDFFRMNKAIPVERASDLAKQGAGTIKFEDEITLKGTDTKFTTEFKKGDSVKFLSVTNQERIDDHIIESIVSDT